MNVEIVYKLYEWRVKRNMSSRDLAKASGVSKSTINNIENGRYDPTVKTLCLLAGALKTTPEKLFLYKFAP